METRVKQCSLLVVRGSLQEPTNEQRTLSIMHLLFASSNPHKIEEVRAILAPLGIDVAGLDSLENPAAEPVEDGATFEENARIKAIAYAKATGQTCLADDSG